jgi:trypsin
MILVLQLILFLELINSQRAPGFFNRLFRYKGPRIVGGYEVNPPKKYAFMVSIQIQNKHTCGGILLNQNTVLTAAHCVFNDISEFTVKVGRHNLTKGDNEEGGASYRVLQRTIHPNFEDSVKGYDVAVWKIESVHPKFLDSQISLDQGEIAEDPRSKLTVIGWGRTADGGPVSPVLLQITIPVVDWNRCAKNYLKEGVEMNNKTQICAGYFDGGIDSCQGDSGGPLFGILDNVVYLVGLVSYGVGCALPDVPGIYTKIAGVAPFINSNL